MRVYSPAEWGARVDYDSWNDPFTPDDGVALHHGGGSNYEAAHAPYSFEKETRLLRGWEWYHLSRGWRGLAYGFGVAQSGRLYRIRGFNRYGAHLGDIDGDGIANNDEIIPIIWLASGKYHTVSPEAANAIDWLRGNVLEATSPRATFLYGHQEIQLDNPTSCPGPGGMEYVRSHRERRQTMATEAEKLVIDIAFDLLGAQGDRSYYYNLPQSSPDWGNLRAAVRRGARELLDQIQSSHGGEPMTDAEIRQVVANALLNG